MTGNPPTSPAAEVIASALDSFLPDLRPSVLVNQDRAHAVLAALVAAGYEINHRPDLLAAAQADEFNPQSPDIIAQVNIISGAEAERCAAAVRVVRRQVGSGARVPHPHPLT